MSNDKLLTDDYVSGLLAQDAKDCSLKYSAMGMEAFRDTKKPSMPKPNTRFLRHIIKDTDTHNKALLAKEASESRARLKDLEYAAKDSKKRKQNPDARDIRRRQMGDIRAILGGKKSRRDEDDRERPRRWVAEDELNQQRSRYSRRDGDLLPNDDGCRRHERLSERDFDERNAASGRDKRTRLRIRRDCSSSEDDAERRRDRICKRHRSKSPNRHRPSRSPNGYGRKHRTRSYDRPRMRRALPKADPKLASPQDEDSDPLDDFIGPPPPPKYRGRGTIGGAEALDRRFSDSYDPKLDVRTDDEDDPWDDAVESFRDRQKLRLYQDQRMKDAGFTAKEIQRARGLNEQIQRNVVWSKAGEKREWDKGKGTDVASDDDDDAAAAEIDIDDTITFVKQTTLFSEQH